MQREKNVKVKEVIESLCRLLALLRVDSIPSAETFRRAKLNKGEDAVVLLWRLLYNIILKADPLEYGCSCTTHTDKVSQSRVVRGFLWTSGYGEGWVMGAQPQNISSRQLLLALGWLLSSGDVLEVLLSERIMELDIVTLATMVSLRTAGPVEWTHAESEASDPKLLRRLQWQIGRLRFQRRSLMSIQEEKAKLLNLILSSSLQTPSSSSSSDDQTCINSTAFKEAYQRVETLCDVLEGYLHWKHLESLFWSWMDSVLDCQLTDLREGPTGGMAPVHQASRGRGGPPNASLGRLEGMVLRLQTGLRHAQPGQVQSLMEGRRRGLSGASLEEVERRVSLRLLGLVEDSSPGAFSQSYRPRLQPGTLKTAAPGEARWSGKSQASQLLVQLQQKEARLLERRNLIRQAQRTEIQELIGQVEGIVLIPPTI